ncbi:MAG: hypothetical protein ACD_2C00258G0005 [uncultured bacterium (gcode 4)]|uniref:Uncharacterized protein n=1 Tax=uncultured bacterium (gcode 4) TaxID=1234023 RepID=K2GZL4_9BACT|nr:MAG: hypothetical protein ACD_2C00258G0005 [uncultured bacterium (gcode 4)]
MKKSIKLPIAIILTLAIAWASVYYYISSNKKQEFIWTLIDETSYKDELAKAWDSEIKKASVKVSALRENSLKLFSANISAYCYSFADSDMLVMSKYFKNLKKDFDKLLNNEYKTSKNALLYIDMPKLIYSSCDKRDTLYKERLIWYLQTTGDNFYLADRKREDENVKNFIAKIEFEDDNVDLAKLKDSPEYFNDIFYNKNLDNLFSLYYPYFEMTKWDFKRFLWKPLNSLEEDNSKKEEALNRFYEIIKPMWYTIQDFRIMSLKWRWFKSNDELVKSIISDYEELDKIIKLDKYVGNETAFKTTVETGSYKKIFEDAKAKDLVISIRSKVLMYSIVSWDYADWYNETWSWKQFFGDENIWNSIIRLNILSVFAD